MSGGDESAPAARRLRLLAIVLLAFFSVQAGRQRFADAPGIDLYHYWVVPTALGLTAGAIGSPFRNAKAYEVVIDEYASRSGGERLQSAHNIRPRLNLNQSPFAYLAFSLLPADYEDAFRIYHCVQYACLIGGFVALAFLCRARDGAFILSALVCYVAYVPIRLDFYFGNQNLVQFALLALALLALREMSSPARQGLVFGALFAVDLAVAVLLKPTTAVMAAALALTAGFRLGPRRSLVALLWSLPVVAALAVAPCLWLGWSAWGDWLQVVASEDRLHSPMVGGNVATSLLLSHSLEIPESVVRAALAVLVVTPLAWAARRAEGSKAGRLRTWLSDEVAVLSFAIVVTFALSPLVWRHYNLILLLPAFLFLYDPAARREAWLSVVALALASTNHLFEAQDGSEGSRWLSGLAWLPLWAAVVVAVSKDTRRSSA